MSTHVVANLERMRWLAGRIDEAATVMYDGGGQVGRITGEVPTSSFLGQPIPASAFGNTSGAAACRSAWLGMEGDAAAAGQALTVTCRSDVTRIYEVAAVFERMDDEAADQLCASGNGLTVFTTHVHSPGRGHTGSNDDKRAGQIDMAIDHAVGTGGATVFTGDLNETRTADTASADTIDSLVDEHGYTDAGIASGATSSEGHGGRIDYVFTSPGIEVTGPAENVDGGPSDHNGVAVEIVRPRW